MGCNMLFPGSLLGKKGDDDDEETFKLRRRARLLRVSEV